MKLLVQKIIKSFTTATAEHWTKWGTLLSPTLCYCPGCTRVKPEQSLPVISSATCLQGPTADFSPLATHLSRVTDWPQGSWCSALCILRTSEVISKHEASGEELGSVHTCTPSQNDLMLPQALCVLASGCTPNLHLSPCTYTLRALWPLLGPLPAPTGANWEN